MSFAPAALPKLAFALREDELAFIETNSFCVNNQMDPHVIDCAGSYITPEAHALLATRFGDQVKAHVYLSFIDYSDIGCGRGYLVSLGVTRECGDAVRVRTFGIFGRSSAACASLSAAYKEAAVHLLAQLFTEPISNALGHMRRIL
mgnify:CR=1 FL=1